jgi:nucleoid-associated protein YgaU
VASGETLSDIARSYLGSAQRWPEIQSLNKIQDPRRVRAGDILQIPATR